MFKKFIVVEVVGEDPEQTDRYAAMMAVEVESVCNWCNAIGATSPAPVPRLAVFTAEVLPPECLKAVPPPERRLFQA